MKEAETEYRNPFFDAVRWERSAYEWRRLVGSPFCDLTPTQKLILTLMARFGDKWGDNIFPSQRRLALQAGVSTKCVCECMIRADAEGWVVRYMSSAGRGYRRTTYQLAWPAGIQEAALFMKIKFWEGPYKYRLVRVNDEPAVEQIPDDLFT